MIEVDHVTRRYGALVAVDDATFKVAPGEIVGFLGPNGAGKSTLLKMLSTYLAPSAGRLSIAGHDTQKDGLAARRALGYLPEHNALFEGMRVDRFLAFLGDVRGLEAPERGARERWGVERCGLEPVLRQRIGLAAALLHDPPVVLLDEPTHGLDPLQVIAFRAFLDELRPGRAILFSSHVLAEVVAISDRLIAIDRGRIVLDAAVPDLRARAAREGRDLEELLLAGVRSRPAPGTLGTAS